MTLIINRILVPNLIASLIFLEVEVNPGKAISDPTIYLKTADFSSEKSKNEIPMKNDKITK